MAVGLNDFAASPDAAGRQAKDDLAVGGVELDPLSVFVAGTIKVLCTVLVTNLDVMQVGVRFAKKLTGHLSAWRKSDHTLVGAGIDCAVLADCHTAVRWADGGFAVRSESPTRNSVKRH